MAIGDRTGLKLANIPSEKPASMEESPETTSGAGGTPPRTPGTPGTQKKEKTERQHRFEIQKKLGSGTYGKVSLAYDHKFNQEVSI